MDEFSDERLSGRLGERLNGRLNTHFDERFNQQFNGLFDELILACRRGVDELRDAAWSCPPDWRRSAKTPPFNLACWRQRLEETAKGIDFCGSFLFVAAGGEAAATTNSTTNSTTISTMSTTIATTGSTTISTMPTTISTMPTTMTPQHAVRLGKLREHADSLVRLTLQLPASAGRHYRDSVREAVIATLTALGRLPEVYGMARRTRQGPAAFQWNQTLRLRDIPDDCVAHLLVRWERWSGELRKVCDDCKELLSRAGDAATDEDYDHAYDTEQGNPAKDRRRSASPARLEPAEAAALRDCEAIVRLLRSLFRKVRGRCIANVDAAREAEAEGVVDVLFAIGQEVSRHVHALFGILAPPHDANAFTAVVVGIVRAANELVEVACEVCPEAHCKWFAICNVHFDNLLVPLLERNPIR